MMASPRMEQNPMMTPERKQRAWRETGIVARASRRRQREHEQAGRPEQAQEFRGLARGVMLMTYGLTTEV